jgi:hypothetical protein
MMEAEEAARIEAEEGTAFQSAQAMLYAKSGFTGEGSPALVMEDTRRKSAAKANALRARGTAIKNLYNQKAAMLKKQGRSAFLGGLVKGVGTGLTSYFGSKGTSIKSAPNSLPETGGFPSDYA